MPRFENDENAILASEIYSEVFEKKGVKFLRIRRTKDFSQLRGVEVEVATEHIWTKTDTLFRLANNYFGSYENWWVIALVNKKPTDGHFSIGDVVYIPKNASLIKEAMK
tara:strand:- start:298 stop:624 length:327 start_codon:yes stop_codon:yes gene_type:complete